jgi:IclR family pca regulon transcriptional regulator
VTSDNRDSDTYVQSLARGLSVICAFGPGRAAMTLSEVAEAAGVTRAGARRILLTLQTLGYVSSDGRRFQLSPKILNLGYSYLSSLDFWSFAEPIMEALVERVRESCSASVLDGDDIVYVLRVPTRRIMSINLSTGSRLPAYAASMGRVLLAALSDDELEAYLAKTSRTAYTKLTVYATEPLREVVLAVRENGWALVDQELEEGLRSIAVPLHSRSGRVLGALNISAHASRVSVERLVEEFLPELRRAGREIDAALRLQP